MLEGNSNYREYPGPRICEEISRTGSLEENLINVAGHQTLSLSLPKYKNYILSYLQAQNEREVDEAARAL